MIRVKKVVAYITRGAELLVFEHRDYPDAGIQVPAGTVEDNEDLERAAIREAEEESGLTDLQMVRYFGSQDFEDPDAGHIRERHYFHFTTQNPREIWLHWERNASGTTEHFAFDFRWMSFTAARQVLHPEFSAKLDDIGERNII